MGDYIAADAQVCGRPSALAAASALQQCWQAGVDGRHIPLHHNLCKLRTKVAGAGCSMYRGITSVADIPSGGLHLMES